MGVDAFDIVAIILGVWFTIRKLDAQRRKNSEFPHVAPLDFEAWQHQEVAVYTAALFACFAKVFADWGFVYFVAPGMAEESVRRIGATIDLSWVAVMIVTIFRARNLSKRKRELRIVLGGLLVDSKELSTELKAALRSLEDQDYRRAEYELKQISLDPDESQQGLALYYLGECYLRQDKKEEARESFQKSVEVDPSLKQPQEALARLASTG